MLGRAGRLLIALFAVAMAGPAGAQPPPKDGGGKASGGGWADEVRSAIGGAKGEAPRGQAPPAGGPRQSGASAPSAGDSQTQGQGAPAKPDKR